MDKTSFTYKCIKTLKKIPKGKVTTYSELAKAVGHKKAMRAVGTAMSKNPWAPEYPCHRVVKNDGTIGEYTGGTAKKIALLKKEGVPVEGKKIPNMKKYFYKF